MCERTVYSCNTCPAGTFEYNNQCHDCSAGTFSNDNVAGKNVQDNGCHACPAGKFQSGSVFDSCENCGSGTFNANEGRFTPCQNCDHGTQPHSDRKSCETCSPGRFNLAAGEVCELHNACAKGKGVSTIGTATTDTACVTCNAADMKYSDQVDFSSCENHQQCGVGMGSNLDSSLLTNEANNQCVNCDPGAYQYSDAVDYGRCKSTITSCVEGEKYILGTSSAPASCDPCTGNTFNDDNGRGETCDNKKSSCEEGTELKLSGTFTTNNECSPCAAGKFQDAPDGTTCQDKLTTCGTGYYIAYALDAKANNNCTACDNKPELNSEWEVGLHEHNGACSWKCAAGYELTHGGSKCAKAGASIQLKAAGTNSQLTMHDNGVLKLTGGNDVCLEATMCSQPEVNATGGGEAAIHSKIELHSRRLTEVKSEMDARWADMEARLTALEAK